MDSTLLDEIAADPELAPPTDVINAAANAAGVPAP